MIKSEISIRDRSKAVVDDYLEFMESGASDAGWHGDSQLSKWVVFAGRPPDSSGYYGFDAPFSAQHFLKSVTQRQLRAARIMKLLHDKSVREFVGVLTDRAYRGKTKTAIDPYTEQRIDILYTTEHIAALANVTVNTYRIWVSRGYEFLDSLLAK